MLEIHGIKNARNLKSTFDLKHQVFLKFSQSPFSTGKRNILEADSLRYSLIVMVGLHSYFSTYSPLIHQSYLKGSWYGTPHRLNRSIGQYIPWCKSLVQQ